MNLLTKASPETHEIIANTQAAYKAGEITEEQRDEIVKSCFAREAEMQMLANKYAEAV